MWMIGAIFTLRRVTPVIKSIRNARPMGDLYPHRGDQKMKYLGAWLVGVPTSLILLWFVMNQTGC